MEILKFSLQPGEMAPVMTTVTSSDLANVRAKAYANLEFSHLSPNCFSQPVTQSSHAQVFNQESRCFLPLQVPPKSPGPCRPRRWLTKIQRLSRQRPAKKKPFCGSPPRLPGPCPRRCCPPRGPWTPKPRPAPTMMPTPDARTQASGR